jgi:DNA-binding beta-propeller fold protein YncE
MFAATSISANRLDSNHESRRPASRGLVLVTVTALVTAGCASGGAIRANSASNVGTPAAAAEAAVPLPVWPEPPLPPRVAFVRVLSDGQSLGTVKTGLKESFVNFISGKQPSSDHLYQPMDIAASDDGQRVYIADFGQGSVFIGNFATKTFAPAPQPLERPFGIAIDNDENIYVSEQQARRITVLNRSLRVVRVIAHPSLIRPSGLDVDRNRGLVYVADPSRQDSPDHTVKVFDLEGRLVRTIGSARGDCDGCLYFPTFVATDSKGHVYVSNTLNARIDVFDADGKFVKRIGERGNSYGMFDKPKGVALDSFDNVYIVDSGWSNVQIFNQKGEVLLFFGGRGENPGLLMNPTGITIDKNNRIYVADFLNYRVSVFQLVDGQTQPVLENTTAAAGAAPAGPVAGAR